MYEDLPLSYLAPIFDFGLGNVFDSDLEAVGVPDPCVDDAEASLAQDMTNLVGFLEAVSGVHDARVAADASAAAHPVASKVLEPVEVATTYRCSGRHGFHKRAWNNEETKLGLFTHS